LAPVRLQQLEAQFTPVAIGMARTLPAGQPVDLVEHYAKPWSLEVAGIAAGVAPAQRERLSGLARGIFDAACEPYDAA
jgi:cytochrome P450